MMVYVLESYMFTVAGIVAGAAIHIMVRHRR